MLAKLKNHFKDFVHNEEGSELMQWAIIIVIVAGLAAIAIVMSGKLKDKLGEAQSAIDNL